MHRLSAGIGLVLGMAAAIVRQADDLVRRIVPAAQRLACLVPPAILTIFINVVTGMEDEVDRRIVSNRLVGIEVAEHETGAGRERDTQTVEPAGGQRPGAANRRNVAVEAEAVIIGLPRLQPAGQPFGGVIAVRPGRDLGAHGDAGEGRILRDFADQGYLA